MVELEVEFSYLNRSFRHKVPRCPECGQVYIPEELAAGRMSEVEKNLEDK
jgi:phage FluMu protein Com